MEEIKKLTEELHREWNEVKEMAEERLSKLPDADKLSEYDELFEKFDKRVDEIETAAKRLRQDQRERRAGEMPEEAKAHSAAFAKFIKEDTGLERRPWNGAQFDLEKAVEVVPRIEVKGGKNVVSFDYKALSVDSDPRGGYLVSPTVSQQFITRLFDTSPIRQYASVEIISGDAFEEPVDDDEATVGWVGERASRSETDTPDIDWLRIPLHEIYANPRSTQKLLDMRSDVEGWLAGKVADKISREENTQFITGNGVAKPKGINSYVDDSTSSWNKVKSVVSGSASALTADGLISLKADLQTGYLPNAVFFMNRTTRSTIRKFRYDAVTASDEAGGFMWEPGLRAGDPDMLLGHPLVIFEDMPDEASNAYPVGFGDLRQGYQILDHTRGLRILRDPFSAKPHVEFYTTKYVGGGVRQGRALRLQKCST